jgi:hypothetical protein
MQEEEVAFLPMTNPGENPRTRDHSGRVPQLPTVDGREKPDGPLRQVLEESTLDALELQLHKPLHLSSIDLRGIVTQGVTTLSSMSAELGVVLRIRIRGESNPVTADTENIRRSIYALIIHLLTLSQPQGNVVVGVKSEMQNGKRGMSVQFSADKVVVPWGPGLEGEEGSGDPPEVLACRRLVEKNGGSLSVQSGEDEALDFIVWIPLKGAGKK